MSKHLEWIDYAKGIAILLVILGHAFPDASAVGGKKMSILEYFVSLSINSTCLCFFLYRECYQVKY